MSKLRGFRGRVGLSARKTNDLPVHFWSADVTLNTSCMTCSITITIVNIDIVIEIFSKFVPGIISFWLKIELLKQFRIR